MIGWIKYLSGCDWSKENDIFESCQVLSQHESEILNDLDQRLSFLGSQRFVPRKKEKKQFASQNQATILKIRNISTHAFHVIPLRKCPGLHYHNGCIRSCLNFTRHLNQTSCQRRTQYSIVKFRIPGYPGPSRDPNTEVRLMRDKIKYECSVQLYVATGYDFTVKLSEAYPSRLH